MTPAAARAAWLAEKRAEAAGAGTVSAAEIVPSRRDFLQFVDTRKQAIALVPRLARANPETGGAWPGLDLVAYARRCDDADTAALAVRTAAVHGGALADLAAVAAAVTAPLLCDDLCVSTAQMYRARLQGADAVLLPADALAPGELAELAATARSMHMTAVIEVGDEIGATAAAGVATACIGLWCPGSDGFVELSRAALLARAAGTRPTVLLLSEPRRLDDLRALAGAIDAAVVGDALLDAADPAAVIAPFEA